MDTPLNEEGDPELAAFWLRFFRWIVAALQIIGGLFGLYYVFVSPYNLSHFVLLSAFVLFVASVWGGVLLTLDRPGGVVVSLIIQAMQVLQIDTDGFVYCFFCGVKVAINLYFIGFNLSYHFPALFYVSNNPPSDLSSVGITFTGVNVVAVLAIICLLCVRSAHSQLLLAPSKVEPPTADIWPPSPKA